MTDAVGISRILTLVLTDLADSTALKTQRGDQAVGQSGRATIRPGHDAASYDRGADAHLLPLLRALEANAGPAARR